MAYDTKKERAETSGDDAAEEWLTPVKWKEDSAVKVKRRERGL